MLRSILIFFLFLVGQVLLAVFALAIGNMDAFVGNTAPVMDINAISGSTIGRGALLANLILIAVLIACRLTSSRRPLTAAFRKKMPTGSGAALLGFIVLSLGISLALSPLDLNDLGMIAKFDEMKSDILCILSLAIVGPIAEELVFRDGILREMMKSRAKPWIAITTSALAFALVHGDPAQMVPAAIMGIALGWLYTKTNSLRLCLLAHVANNSLACIEMQFPQLDAYTTNSPTVSIVLLGVCLAYFGIRLLTSALKKVSADEPVAKPAAPATTE